jgi:5-methylcytosine-specific restriction endonuclease McrA
MRRHGEFCDSCGRGPLPGDPLQVDHIVPRAKGGSNEPSNLQVLHRSENAAKKDGRS